MEKPTVHELTQCPLCSNKVRAEGLNLHLLKVHLKGLSELLPDVLKTLEQASESKTVMCVHCNSEIKKAKLAGHLVRAHRSIYPESLVRQLDQMARVKLSANAQQMVNEQPQGSKKIVLVKAQPKFSNTLSNVVDAQTGIANIERKDFAQFLNTSRLAASLVERCECKRVVVFVEIVPGSLKAFDVDSRHRLIGPHSCDGPKSESLFALNGGAMDSNRRRH